MINWTGVYWQAEKEGSYVRAQLEKRGGLRCGSGPKRGVFTAAHTYTEHISPWQSPGHM